jgi:putative membrane protein
VSCCGFGPLIMFVWALFLVVVIVGVLLLIRAFWSQGALRDERGDHASSREASEILEERYAKGEIDREEFEERRRVLGP